MDIVEESFYNVERKLEVKNVVVCRKTEAMRYYNHRYRRLEYSFLSNPLSTSKIYSALHGTILTQHLSDICKHSKNKPQFHNSYSFLTE